MGIVYGYMDCFGSLNSCCRSRQAGDCLEYELLDGVAASMDAADAIVLNSINHPGHGVAWSQLCLGHTSDLLLMASIDPLRPDRDYIKMVMENTRRLVLGNRRGGEFTADKTDAEAYLALAAEMGFEWVCPWTPYSLLDHMRANDWALRDLLVASETLCISFTAYVIAGWLYGNPGIPHQADNATSLAGVDLRARFGLTEDRLRDYIAPLSILSGAGGQVGIDNGVVGLMNGLGFDGIMAAVPFTLPPVRHDL